MSGYKSGILGVILGAHKLWLQGDERGFKADLRWADLREANLSKAYLSEADLRWADLREANLSKAYLSEADLSWADLREANLSGADLSGANLSWANLSKAYLSWADLSEADLSGADLSGADLSGADLSGAYLSEANLSWANLRWAFGNGGQGMTCFQDKWKVVITKESIAIGCQQHSPDEWWAFSDKEITAMDREALAWWCVHKPIIQALYNAKFGEGK